MALHFRFVFLGIPNHEPKKVLAKGKMSILPIHKVRNSGFLGAEAQNFWVAHSGDDPKPIRVPRPMKSCASLLVLGRSHQLPLGCSPGRTQDLAVSFFKLSFSWRQFPRKKTQGGSFQEFSNDKNDRKANPKEIAGVVIVSNQIDQKMPNAQCGIDMIDPKQKHLKDPRKCHELVPTQGFC